MDRMISGKGEMSRVDELKRELLMRRLKKHAKKGNGSREPMLERADRSEGAPLSWSQQRLWFLEQFEDLGAAYHIEGALRLEGALDEPALQRTLDRIVERHEALRTVFGRAGDGEPVQRVVACEGFALERHDLSMQAEPEQRQAVRQMLQEASARRFELERGPLIRGLLVKLGERQHLLWVSMHHIVSDGWSMGVLTDEVARLYAAFSQGQADPLAPLPVQYGDYAHWQRQWLSGERLDAQLGFWKEYLAGAPALLELPTDKPRPAVQSYAGEVVRTRLPAGLTAGLQGLARRHGATLFMVLQAGWALLMGRLSGQDDVVIGTPVANRRRSELEGLIGFFVNTVALRTRLDAKQSVGQLLDAVRQSTLSAYAHQDTPFEQVVEAVRPQRSLSHSPLFQVMLVLQNTPQPEVELPGLRLRGEELDRQVSQFDLSLSAFENDDGLGVELEYCTALFERETVQRWLGYWQRLLESMVADETQPVGELAWLPQAERDQVLRAFNDTVAAYPKEALIHELFEQQVKRTPEAVAVQYEDEQLTYAQLNARANQLAHRLRGLKDEAGAALVVPDARVAICVERSLEMVVGLLGILKSGAAYVPVDPEYPQDRIAYVLQDAGAKVLLTQGHLRDGLPTLEAATSGSNGSSSGAVHVLLLDDENTYAGQSEENIGRQETGQTSGDLAYVIYTSGSTGLPKGVMNEHRGVVNRLCWMQQAYGLTAEDRVLQKTAFSFDVSVWEFFWTLLNGARLVMARPGGHRDPQYLVETIGQTGITTLHFVPSMLQMFVYALPEGETGCASLQRIVCSGEELPLSLQHACQERLGHAALYNLYGPTEAAIDVTHWTCDAGQQQGYVPIGRPIANTQIYILDAQGQPVPVGVSGEIHIAGDGVARGYLNRPELTAERFVQDPFSEQADARMYRTGDLGRWRADGAIEYLGRNDFQVKIRGLRIELGEIEAKLAEQPQVREAVVLAREDGAGDRRLVAYVTARADGVSAGDVGRDAAGHDAAGDTALNTAGDAGQGIDWDVAGTVEQDAGRDAGVVPAQAVQALDVDVLREQLKAVLPGYMVPSAFVVLKEMPLTPNGKVDRKALPAPDLSALQTSAYEVPQTPTEEILASIWQDLLGVERIGRHDNFFDLGGHSLLITKLVARIGQMMGVTVSVRQLFQTARLSELAALIAETRQKGESALGDEQTDVDPAREVVLDEAIVQSLASLNVRTTPVNEAGHVLLTGATGFLGAYLLEALLHGTDAMIHCLVRAADVSQGKERLKRNMMKYGLWKDAYQERIRPVLGDLGKKRFGLHEGAFDELAGRVDVVFHNGAFVNFIYPYEALKPVNVQGTHEAIRLAALKKMKPFHFVSTVSVFPQGPQNGGKILESMEPEQWEGLAGGYPQSKWVAEKLAYMAGRHGLPVRIYRPGSIGGTLENGICNTGDMIFRLIKACIDSGEAPASDQVFNLAPVDYVSRAMVHLANSRDPGTLAFNVINPESVTCRRFFETLRDMGYPVRLVPEEQWYERMMEEIRGSEEHTLHPFMSILAPDEGAQHDGAHVSAAPVFDCAKTREGLKGSGIRCPEVSATMLEAYMGFFQRSGFISLKERA